MPSLSSGPPASVRGAVQLPTVHGFVVDRGPPFGVWTHRFAPLPSRLTRRFFQVGKNGRHALGRALRSHEWLGILVIR
jgi:hypothetical protein